MIAAADVVRPKKRLRTDVAAPKDKFNLSNDQFYEVSKEGGRHRVRQTFGQLVVEHAYPAQKLQLPFVSHTLTAVKPHTHICNSVNSTRPVYQNKKHAPSTGPLYSSHRTLNCISVRSGRPRRKRTKLDAKSARAEMWEKACIARTT